MFDVEKVHKNLAETHIQHPQIASLENALLAHVKSGFRAEGAMIFVLKGESGSGKSRVITRVIEHVCREASEELIDEGETLVSPLPAFQVKVPSDSTLKALAAKTQAMLGARSRRVQTQEDINMNIRDWMRRRRVRAIAFDEVQQLIEREGKRPIVIQNAANWLKVFLDESNVPMILVGTDDLEPILDHDKRQLRNRTVRIRVSCRLH